MDIRKLLPLSLLLLSVFTLSNAGRKDAISKAHPFDFLVSTDPESAGQQEERQISSAEEEEGMRASADELIERLSSRGTDTNKPSVRYILDLYEKMENGEDVTTATGHKDKEAAVTGSDVIRGLSASVPSRSRHRADVSLSFPLSGFSDDESTELAELRLRPLPHHPEDQDVGPRRQQRSDTRPARRGGLQRVRVSILDKEGDRQVERIYRVKWRRDQNDGFTVLDITRVLRDMAASNVQRFQNGTLEIALRKTRRVDGGRKNRSRRDTLNVVPSLNPEDDAILVIYSKSASNMLEEEVKKHKLAGNTERAEGMHGQTKNSRAKRGARQGRKNQKGKCVPKDLIVDFETLGWSDNIVFPIRYNARTCSGKCPSPVSHNLKPTNHAILQSMMRLHNKGVRRPCCVPVSYKPLMMLYKRADGNVEIRHHPNMVVDECGCR